MADPWWDFSLDPESRTDSHAARILDKDGVPIVNPPGEAGRLALDYGTYLGLDTLLTSQKPASRVPDERIFVIIHQLFELLFKQMTFDLGVIAKTFEILSGSDDAAFNRLATEPLPDERGPDPFWRPAMTAAGRLRHAARKALPAVMSFVGFGEDDDVLFSSEEYSLFRDFLAPASGFQTAQLRLIQRALGKSPLLEVHVFPGDTYGQNYSGCPVGHVALGDPLILQGTHKAAFPGPENPSFIVTQLDDLAHGVLGRLGHEAELASEPPPVQIIQPEDVDRAVARLRTTLGDDPNGDRISATFRADLEAGVEEENARRAGLGTARRGAQMVHADYHHTCLAFVLNRIAATDAALHAPDPDSFLSVHRRAVRRHVVGDSGTGGGGMPYLVTSQRFLLPLFPALVAYADLGMSGDDDRDRW